MNARAKTSSGGWPAESIPGACPVFARNEILIEAPPAVIWSYLVRASRWPQWYPFSANVRLRQGARELGLGVQFDWHTFGIGVGSQVTEWEPNRRIAWNARAPFVFVYHRWHLSAVTEKLTQVTTEETQRGFLPSTLRIFLRPRLRMQHEVWLQNLKCLSEAFEVEPDAPRIG